MAQNQSTEYIIIEDVIIEVLGPIYNRFGFDENIQLQDYILEILEDDELSSKECDFCTSESADKIRNELWSRYNNGGSTSAIATCKLFIALGRKNELAWLLEEANMS